MYIIWCRFLYSRRQRRIVYVCACVCSIPGHRVITVKTEPRFPLNIENRFRYLSNGTSLAAIPYHTHTRARANIHFRCYRFSKKGRRWSSFFSTFSPNMSISDFPLNVAMFPLRSACRRVFLRKTTIGNHPVFVPPPRHRRAHLLPSVRF